MSSVRIPAALAEPRKPLRAVFAGWLFAFPPSIVLALVAEWLLPNAARPSFEIAGLETVALLVLFAPLIETLVMAAVLELLLRFVPPAAAILASAVGWGIAHSLAAPAWGLVIWWPFLIFSTLYVTWSKRSVLAALAVVTCVHALQNLVPSLLLVFS